MRCLNCGSLVSLNGFGGYEHYETTKQAMDNNVKNGYFKIVEISQFEIVYQCNDCATKWALGEPDFPVVGYFMEKH